MSAPHRGSAAAIDHTIAKALLRLVEASRRGGDATPECLAVEAAIRRAIDQRETGVTGRAAVTAPGPAHRPEQIGDPIPRRDTPPPRDP